jgi:dihydroxy-acid dehydratase
MALGNSDLKRVALVTDGRFSGATSGPCVGHVSPEAYEGGPLAAVKDGDEIEIDIPNRTLKVDITDKEMAERLKGFTPPEAPVPQGYMSRYVKQVSSAAEGAVLR